MYIQKEQMAMILAMLLMLTLIKQKFYMLTTIEMYILFKHVLYKKYTAKLNVMNIFFNDTYAPITEV